MSRSNKIADLIDNNGDIKSAHLDNISVTPTAVSDQANTSTGYIDVPSGTTAQRPTLDNAGGTRFNTTNGSLEFYDGTNWISTNLIPTINSITGDIYAGASSTLTLSLTNATDTIDVKYYESGTLLATDSGVTVTNGSATSTVPSAVYGQTANDTITIKVFNVDGTASSNSIDKTVLALPSGGALDTTSVSGYRIHTFTSSSTTGLVNTINNLSVEYLVIGAGGSGGPMTGAGAGGYRTNVTGQTSGRGANAEGALTLAGSPSGTNHQVTIEGGGSGYTGGGASSGWTNGGVSSFSSGSTLIESLGGGRGSAEASAGISGGCGGGGHNSGGTGTAGQGYDGGQGVSSSSGCAGDGGGGGGAGSAGSGRNGGNGQSSTITNTSNPVTRGGGGAGEKNLDCHSNTGGTAGTGGGGPPRTAGTANTGGGGGSRSNGGSGIVIIRYQLP